MMAFESAPPFAAPLRFFLTAPLFALLAGVLVAVDGPDIFASRWMPGALAVTHLLTIGFMLQMMLGALIQILPVVAGASLPRPLWLATIIHLGLTCGALMLAGGFYFSMPVLLSAAALLLGITVGIFLLAAIYAFWHVPSTSPTIRGLKLALFGLFIVVGLGVLMAFALSYGWALPLVVLADLHAGWGLGGWAGVLLAAIAYVVVPMFQLTSAYPARPSWMYPIAMLALLLLWSLAVLFDWPLGIRLSQGCAALLGLAFAGLTLRLQGKRRRARADVTYRYWQVGLISSIFALFMLFTVAVWPAAVELQGWTTAFGVLLIAGGYLSFIIGMLYKIVPFLTWMHLQTIGQAKVSAPNMNQILPSRDTERQMLAYTAAVVLLLAATIFPEHLSRLAGGVFALACAWLWFNLLAAARRYAWHKTDIEAKLAAKLAAA